MLGLSSWSELAPDQEALDDDGAYRLCEWLAVALFAALFIRPFGAAEVLVTFDPPAPSEAVVRGALTPVRAHRPDGPPSSRQQDASCRPAGGTCRLSFRWAYKKRPIWPEDMVLVLTAGDADRPVNLGQVMIHAPGLGGTYRVRCAPQGCVAS